MPCFLTLAEKDSAGTEDETFTVPGGDRHSAALCFGSAGETFTPSACQSLTVCQRARRDSTSETNVLERCTLLHNPDLRELAVSS